MNKRQISKEQTRKKILESAKSIISEKGFLSLKTIDIAKRCKIAHGTVFLHFPNKEILLIELIETFGKKMMGNIHGLIGRNADIRAVLEAHLSSISKDEGFYRFIFIEYSHLPVQAKDTILAIQSGLSFHLSKAIESDVVKKSIKTMPLHLFFNTWIGLVHHYLVNRELFSPGRSVMEEKGAELIDHFINLISK